PSAQEEKVSVRPQGRNGRSRCRGCGTGSGSCYASLHASAPAAGRTRPQHQRDAAVVADFGYVAVSVGIADLEPLDVPGPPAVRQGLQLAQHVLAADGKRLAPSMLQ